MPERANSDKDSSEHCDLTSCESTMSTSFETDDFNDICKYVNISEKDFLAWPVSEVIELFKRADVDGSGGLDMDEFSVAMQKVFPHAGKQNLCLLHMKIDTNCDGVVDLEELLEFFVFQHGNSRTKTDLCPFPLSPEFISIGLNRHIVKILPVALPNRDNSNTTLQKLKTYNRCHYVALTENGVLTFFTDGFENSHRCFLRNQRKKEIPHSHNKNPLHVYDMIYINDLNEIAVSTSEGEVLFFDYTTLYQGFSRTKYCIVNDECPVTAMEYTRIGAKAMFSMADGTGSLIICISQDVLKGGLFQKELLCDMVLKDYQCVRVSTLLKHRSFEFYSFKISVFSDILNSLQYIPLINSYIVCGRSAKFMSVVGCRISSCLNYTKAKTMTFKCASHLKHFNCAGFTHLREFLISGGDDGVLRIWVLDKKFCQYELRAHCSPIVSVKYSVSERTFFSVSTDKNVRIWNELDLTCLQSFFVDCLKTKTISAVCYEDHNNELVLADKELARCLGQGTDVFKQRIPSHDQPLWDVIYNSQFKQLVSLSLDACIRVWDILTGEFLLEFSALSNVFTKPVAITFDPTNRKLLVLSKNKEIAYWNFNNGKEIEVLPLKVPNHVTGLIQERDTLFISALNCKTIFALNLQNGNHKYLQHPLLKDTCAMELHKDTLITISSDGNAVAWDLENYRVCFYFHIFDSPKVHHAGIENQGTIFDREPLIEDLHDPESLALSTGYKSMGGVVSTSLKTRTTNRKTAILLVSHGGFVFAWSIQRHGGVIAKFRAVTKDSAKITCMTTNKTEKILLTGDSTGRLCLWDIQVFTDRTQSESAQHKTLEEWHTSLCAPPLLRSWQGSNKGIASVLVCPDSDNIISAGQDHNVKIWTMQGDFLGTFMKDTWDLSLSIFPERKVRRELKKQDEIDSSRQKLDTNENLGKEELKIKKRFDEINDSIAILERLKMRMGIDNEKLKKKKEKKSVHLKAQPLKQPIRGTDTKEPTGSVKSKTNFAKNDELQMSPKKTTRQSQLPMVLHKEK
uniref:WD repeat-containing protein on Y chromosome n=1 Tax=Oryzias sinensis TaxID=183150 RepID=A0A8C7YHG7_9TELE